MYLFSKNKLFNNYYVLETKATCFWNKMFDFDSVTHQVQIASVNLGYIGF